MQEISPQTSPKLANLGPPHLRDATRAWWESVASQFDLEPHHVMLLTAAAEAWDRLQDAREAIVRDGAFVKDRFKQLKAHPAVAVERDARIGFARLLRELNLDSEPSAEPRPPPIAGRYLP
jgi:phage terminase small subunit